MVVIILITVIVISHHHRRHHRRHQNQIQVIYTLTERYQLRENIKATRILIPLVGGQLLLFLLLDGASYIRSTVAVRLLCNISTEDDLWGHVFDNARHLAHPMTSLLLLAFVWAHRSAESHFAEEPFVVTVVIFDIYRGKVTAVVPTDDPVNIAGSTRKTRSFVDKYHMDGEDVKKDPFVIMANLWNKKKKAPQEKR